MSGVGAARALRRVDQLLSACGYCSRREARGWVKEGWVTVGGVPVTSPDAKVDPALVLVEGEPLDHPDGLVVLFHKPVGTICTHEDEEGPTIYTLLPERWRHRNPTLSSVGRLDKDASGLLILTDDGPLVQRWTSPRNHVTKLYQVVLDRDPLPEWVGLFQSGTYCMPGETKPCAPAALTLVGPRTATLELTEGRFHQVKRMFAGVGAVVQGLHRLRFGPFELGSLPVGAWMDVTGRVRSSECG